MVLKVEVCVLQKGCGHLTLVPAKVTLFGNRVSVDVLVKMRPY